MGACLLLKPEEDMKEGMLQRGLPDLGERGIVCWWIAAYYAAAAVCEYGGVV